MPTKSRSSRSQPTRHRLPERTVYRPSAALRNVTLGLILILGVAAIWFAYISTRSVLSTVFCALPIGLFFLVVLSYFFYLSRKTTLVLAADGLEYNTPNLSIRTSWANVAKLIDDPLTPRLVLHQPVTVDAHTAAARPLAPSAGGRAIPLRMFGYARGSALGRDLARRAPHLFASAERSPS